MLYYSVAHYYDVSDKRKKERYNHILRHVGAFLAVKESEKEFILVSAIDTALGSPRYKEVHDDLSGFLEKHLPEHKSHVCIVYNWGGTIAALWHTYQHLKHLDAHADSYIAHFEEDFGPRSNEWYPASKELLTSEEIYIGESNRGRIKMRNDDGRITNPIFSGHPRLGDPEVWTDGGFYFSTMQRLKTIDSKVGIFHKGDQNTKYNNTLDGISLGEVGFPTLLYHAGLKFNCLNRTTYFINEWCGGH